LALFKDENIAATATMIGIKEAVASLFTEKSIINTIIMGKINRPRGEVFLTTGLAAFEVL
jgi:hypothetical protein